MNIDIVTYLVYLGISITLTIWVARTLHKNGRIFLVDVFHGNEPLADSVNHLLVVGFYLINLGFVSLALKLGYSIGTPKEGIEALVGKGRHGDARFGRNAFLQSSDLQPYASSRHPAECAAASLA
jgi:hypothetical protein